MPRASARSVTSQVVLIEVSSKTLTPFSIFGASGWLPSPFVLGPARKVLMLASCIASISSAVIPAGAGAGVISSIFCVEACVLVPPQAANTPPSTGMPTPNDAPLRNERREICCLVKSTILM